MGVSKERLLEFGGKEIKGKDMWTVHFKLPDVYYWGREQQLVASAWVESEDLEGEDFDILRGKDGNKIARIIFERSIPNELFEYYKKGYFKMVGINGGLSGDLKGFLVDVRIKTRNETLPEDAEVLGKFLDFHIDQLASAELLYSIMDEYKKGIKKK